MNIIIFLLKMIESFYRIIDKITGSQNKSISYRYLVSFKPDGEIGIIDNVAYEDIDTYGVIILTGKDRGKRIFIRHRNIIQCRKVEENDLSFYKINEVLDI